MYFPKITFGFVNCNRLYYVKSCIESTLDCTSDYQNKEIIVIDNASVEIGTNEYLKELKQRGFKVFKTKKRDPANEYARALNTIVENATGEFIIPLAGDTQCVAKGWIKDFIKLYSSESKIGCICINSQRTPTVISHQYEKIKSNENFLFDFDRPPLAGSADVFMRTDDVRELMYPWCIKNSNHEYPDDSETKMHLYVQKKLQEKKLIKYQVVPVVPIYIGIYTDPRGHNARVRLNRRYGIYKPPFEGYKYYEYYDYSEYLLKEKKFKTLTMEDVAIPIGWKKMLDLNGIWKKNPIDTKDPKETNYVELEK